MALDIKQEAKDIVKAARDVGAEQFGEIILQSIIGTAAPGVMSTILAYQQKRQERMYKLFLDKLTVRMETIEQRLQQLSAHSLLNFKEKYFGMISDYALQEVQEGKITYIANGLTNLAGVEDPQEDMVLSYYDTLLELRLLDIAVLKNYYAFTQRCGKPYIEMLAVWGIDEAQYFAVRSKLERAGLLVSERRESEQNLYANVELLQKYVEALEKKGKMQPNPNFKRVNNRNNYKISRYGKSFMEFFYQFNGAV